MPRSEATPNCPARLDQVLAIKPCPPTPKGHLQPPADLTDPHHAVTTSMPSHHRLTEWLRLARISEDHHVQLLAKAGPLTAGCLGPCSVLFTILPMMETLQFRKAKIILRI